MNSIHTNTLITRLLIDDDLPSDYMERPEEYFVSLSNVNAKKYAESHLKVNNTGFVPGVVLLRNGETPILDLEHETADVISTWVELLALTRSCCEDTERLTFIFDTPYELSMDKKGSFFVLTVHDRSYAKGTSKSYSIQRNLFLQEILKGASDAHKFFESISKSTELEELKDLIIFLKKAYSCINNK